MVCAAHAAPYHAQRPITVLSRREQREHCAIAPFEKLTVKDLSPPSVSTELTRRPCARLVQLSDLHWLTDADALQRGMNTRTSFLQVLDAARPMITRADAVLLTGDIAHDELPSTYQALKPYLSNLETPVWTLPGNHDLPDSMAAEFAEPPYSYLSHHTLENWLIVMLDSQVPNRAGGELGVHELERLEQTVAESQAEHVLVCLHHHPLKLQSKWLDTVALNDSDALLEVLRKDLRYRVVINGHVHQAHDRWAHDIRWLSCPSTNSQFTPKSDEFALDSRPPGFRWLNLYEDGQIQTDIAWLNPNAVVTEGASDE